MKTRLSALAIAAVLLLPVGCSNDDPGGPAPPPASSEAGAGNVLRIVITWPGDDFAEKEEFDVRSEIESRIMEKGLGEILQTGTGMGWMDLVIEVGDREGARKAIEGIVREIAPEREFRIEPR